MKIWEFLRDAYQNPDPYLDDPQGYALNQLGHFGIGLGASYLGVPIAVTLALFAFWELAQWKLQDGELWDSVEDFAFVTVGALTIGYGVVAVVGALFLAQGVLYRQSRDNKP